VADTASGTQPAVQLNGITKRFPGVIANSDVNMSVERGTVHAIVGENGAGKSTLMKILYGMQRPDAGTIRINGAETTFTSPQQAIKAGIGMVHQHFMLADNLTVLENVVLGAESLHGIGGGARSGCGTISDAYGLGVATGPAGRGPRAWETASASRSSRSSTAAPGCLILDEPTAGARAAGGRGALGNLRGMKAEGLTVLVHLPQARRGALRRRRHSRCRRGTTVDTVSRPGCTARQLAELMGRQRAAQPGDRQSTVTDTSRAEGGGVRGGASPAARGASSSTDGLGTVHAGEVLGVAGVEGNGQAELVEAIMGTRASTGEIVLADEPISTWNTRRRREAGIGYIPEDRHRQALLLESPLWENRMLGHQTEAPNAKGNPARPRRRPARHRADRARLRRPYARHRRQGRRAVGRQPAEAHRRPRDEPPAQGAHRGPPDARRRRRRPGRDLGPHP
jgi:simple sugar transport system ATP-binding protein